MRHRLSSKARRIYFSIMAVVFVIGVPVLVSYSLGYRLNGDGKLTRTGGITINKIPPGAKVLLQGKEVGTGSLINDEVFIGGLMPGEYEVEVLGTGFVPWKKKLPVAPQKANVQEVIAIPQPLIFKEVIVESKEKSKNGEAKSENVRVISQTKADELEALFRSSGQNGDERSLVFGEGATVLRRFGGLEVVQKKDELLAGWAGVDDRLPKSYVDENGLTVRIFQLGNISEEIRDIDFLPDRFEMALITLPSGLYLTEINACRAYTLFPLYKKPGINVVADASGNIYIKDGERLLILDSEL